MALCQRVTLFPLAEDALFRRCSLLSLKNCAVLSLYELTAAIAGRDRAAHMSRCSRASTCDVSEELSVRASPLVNLELYGSCPILMYTARLLPFAREHQIMIESLP